MSSDFLNKFLTLNCDGTTKQAIGTYSAGSPGRFGIRPSAGGGLLIYGLTFTIDDTDSAYNKYGDLAALTNGTQLLLQRYRPATSDYETIRDLWDGDVIKQTRDWERIGGEIRTMQASTAIVGTQVIFTFHRPLLLIGRTYDTLNWVQRDTTTGLDNHTCFANCKEELFT